LIGVALLGVFTSYFGEKKTAFRFIIALPCYVAVLFVHFNLKLWIPHINPTRFDALYWNIDLLLHPVVRFCMMIRRLMSGIISFDKNFYMTSFIGMFYCSFAYHAIVTPREFGKLATAVVIFQTLGAICYLIAPAVGPFIYEPGVNPIISEDQHVMLAIYQHSLSQGATWLVNYGGENFTAGLAAMPSLHAAGAFLFVIFAWNHGKILLPLYAFLLFFILVTAIASRWHYIVDVPAGLALAYVSYWLATRLTRTAAETPPIEEAVPELAAA
jgi:membrane-associated phospholipid phosphatase